MELVTRGSTLLICSSEIDVLNSGYDCCLALENAVGVIKRAGVSTENIPNTIYGCG